MSAPAVRTAVVTTPRRAGKDAERRAQAVAGELGMPFVPREERSLGEVLRQAEALGRPCDAVLVAGGERLQLVTAAGTFHYHPGIGVNRIRQLAKGRRDWLAQALGLRPGDTVLDATLGLGSDLLVASFVVGPGGRAVGLESQPLLAYMVREGTRRYVHERPEVTEALRRIEVVCAPYQEYLAAAPSKSFDVVYFDPMFEEPVAESSQMAPIRLLANPEPLERAAFDLARRVARRRVVVKDRADGPYVRSGWFDAVLGSPKSRIAYCVAELSGLETRA